MGLTVKATQKNAYKMITESSVLINVSYGVMGNSRKVRAEHDNGNTQQGSIAVNTDAALDLLKVQKTLLTSPELDAIRKADGQMRTDLYKLCHAYDTGVMILPLGLLPMVREKLTTYDAQRAGLVDAFLATYHDLCVKAKTRLGSLYDAKDYPSAGFIQDKFYFGWRFIGFEVPASLQAISAEVYKAETAKVSDAMQDVAQDIVLVMRETVHEMVSHLAERLTEDQDGKPKRLYSSAVTNIQEFLDTFQFRNIVDDTELAAVTVKLKALLSGVSADGLKDNSELKAKMQAKLATITGQLSLMIEKTPSRKIRKG